MVTPETDRAVYIVGDLRVDVGQQRITGEGVDITLPNLSFQLLLALIRAAPNFLSNDSLMASVWPGLVVSPETVAKRINLLREALGDSVQEPRYIAGLRGRGYRLVAAVSRVSPQAPPGEVSPPMPVIESQPVTTSPSDTREIGPHALVTQARRSRWLVWSILLLALVAIALGVRTVNKSRVASAQASSGAALRETGAVSSPAHTVAVLPFENISADAADAYLAQGFPEMILNRLSRIEGLSVIARNSSFALPTSSIDSSEIGRRLNSGYLVGGSVQRDADRLRVAVHLVDSASGTQIWSAHFDRGLHDIFRIEDEIADQIADALSVRLGAEVPKPPTESRSANLQAYLAFVRGRSLLGRFTVAESEAAVPFFEKAIALDPNFASAYASLYDAQMQAAGQRRADMTLARQRNRHLIDRALELDPNLGAAYFARAMWGDEPHDASATAANPLVAARERDFRQGAALDPSNGRGLWAYANFLFMILQQHEAGRTVLSRALWVDPMSPRAHFADAEFSLFDGNARLFERKTLQVLELDPDFVPALQAYAQARWIIDGKLAESLQFYERAIALDPANLLVRIQALAVYLDVGDARAAHAVVAGLPSTPRAAGLLAMHEGDWRRAGLAAYDESGWTADDVTEPMCDQWQGEALRDYALKTRELSRAMAFIRKHYYFGDAAVPPLDICSNAAAVYLSELLAAAGQSDQALALRRAASRWNDANEAQYLGGTRRLRARVLLLDGQRDAALTELAESFRSGYYPYWWYTLDNDALWLPLHDDPRFKAIRADAQKYVDAERSQLEVLRQQGAVPRR